MYNTLIFACFFAILFYVVIKNKSSKNITAKSRMAHNAIINFDVPARKIDVFKILMNMNNSDFKLERIEPENNLVVYEDPTTLLSNGTFLLVICKLDQNGNVNSIDVGAKPKWGIAFKKPLNHFKNQLAGLLTINDFKISV